MAIPHIMPLGFIQRRTDDGAIIMLNNPQESQTLELGTPVTLWRYSPGRLAVAKIRGAISAVGYMTATFTTAGAQIDPRWSADQEIIRPGAPVYLAAPDSFEPDLSRMITPEQAEEIQGLAERHRRISRSRSPGPGPAGGQNPATRAPSNNHHEASGA